MKLTRERKAWWVTLACVATVMPRIGFSAELPRQQPSDARFRVTDIRLTPQGQFEGQIVNSQGHPREGSEIQLWREGHLVARDVADPMGRFDLQVARPGVYQLIAPASVGVVRLWQSDAAPPVAQSSLLIVEGPVVRGQHAHDACGPHPPGAYDGAVMRTLSNPWVFSGLMAAGIAIPVALSDGDDDQEGS